MSRRSVWMLAAVVLLVVLPLLLGGRFEGADGEAAELIAARKDFAPLARPLWEPPSAEVASLLFALQAAFGAFVIGYVLGRLRGRSEAADRRGGDRG